MKRCGDAPFEFVLRNDLHTLPEQAGEYEVKLHGGFATDKREGFRQIYYGMPGLGIMRISSDLKKQELIPIPERLKAMNFHSTKIGSIRGAQRLFLPADNDALVAVLTLDGGLDFLLTRPEFEQYQAEEVIFAPTDTALVEQRLFVADGYGANYITAADVNSKQWVGIFGGKTEDATENGKFATAHGLNLAHNHDQRLVIADRPSSRLQVHGLQGEYVSTHRLPEGSWPCGIDFIQWDGSWLAVVGSLVDPVKDRPAPIYILDADSFAVISTIRPKEELGIELAQHLHNVIWHKHNGQLFLVCQSWNPGYFFVLEKV